MKRNPTLLILCFFALFFWSRNVEATRVMGAEISYTWMSGNTFKVNLSVYRDCGSQLSLPNRQKVYFSAFSCRPTQDSINMVLAGPPVDVSPLCKQEPSNCNGGTKPGIQRFRYEGTVTLPSRCADWVFYFRQCNRSANIGTLVNPQNYCLYVEARLNNLAAPSNSSPRIGNDPIAYLCVGQPVAFNPGVTDPNGDNLKFQMVNPRSNSVIPNVPDANVVVFQPGFSATNPMPTASGFGFDSLNGTMSYTPSSVISGVTAVRISEFRNGKLIGSTMFDIPLIAISCINQVPLISGFSNGTSYDQVVCIGDTLYSEFTAEDNNVFDTVSVTWSGGIPTATFTTDPGKGSAKALLKWFPTVADTGIKTFTITATDNACPSNGFSTQTYTMRIGQKPVISLPNDTVIPCGVTLPISATILKGKAPFLFSWPGFGSTNPVVTVGHGTYTARVQDATGCFAEDSIRLKGSSISGQIRVDTSCVVEGVQLTALPSSTNPNMTFTYEWQFLPEPQILTGKVVRKTFDSAQAKTVRLKILGSDNCSFTLNQVIDVCGPPPAYAIFAPNVCLGREFRIGCGIPGVGGNCGASSICILLVAKNWASFPGNGTHLFPSDSLSPDSNTFQVITKSRYNCSNTNTFKFRVKPSPKVEFLPPGLASGYVFNCNKPDTTIRFRIYKDYRFLQDSLWGRIAYLDTVINIPKTINDTIYYTLRLNKPCVVSIRGIMGECVDMKTFNYLPAANAQVGLLPHCLPTDTVKIYSNLPNTVVGSYTFYLGNGEFTQDSLPVRYYPPGVFQQGYFAVQDTFGCRDTAFFNIDTRLPDFTVTSSKDTSCLNQAVTYTIYDTLLIKKWLFTYLGDSILLDGTRRSDSLVLTQPGLASVIVQVSYKQGCNRSWVLPQVYVRSPIYPIQTLQNVCAVDSSRFQANAISEHPIQSWRWNYEYPPSVSLPFSEDTGRNPVRKFGYNGRFRSILTALDIKGCWARDTLDSTMVLVTKPEFDVNGNCQGDSLVFFFGRVPDQYENIDRFTYFYSENQVETTGNGQGLHQFAQPGLYEVRLTAFTAEGCSNMDTNVLEIKPRPKAIFALPPPEICQGQVFQVDGSASQPSPGDAMLISYTWATNEENPVAQTPVTDVSVVEEGLAYVALQVRSQNGCQDYLKLPFTSRPRPVADFLPNEDDLKAGDRIRFQDASVGGTNWKWDFGDGQKAWIQDSITGSTEHAYTFGNLFQVKLWVGNSFGCADSVQKEINLKSFIALPTAFTPNGDERNDDFGLIYRYIRDLREFKVFNRLGQVVFDGGRNLDARWNGTIDGVAQPNGSYLYVARATSVFGENLEVKGSLTLIR